LPETEARCRQELELQLVLAKVIIATQGHAASGAAEAFDRARALCAGLEVSPQLLTVLFGQWTRALLRAEFVSALRQTEELVDMARKSHDRVWKLISCYTAGFTYFALGSFGSASRYLRRGLDLFDPRRRAEYARPVVGDPRVLLNTYFAWERMCVGHIAEARSICDAAVTEARSLGQFYSLAHALSKQAYLELYIGTPTAALTAAEELQTLAGQHGIAFFQAAATLFQGWCRSELGDAAAGLAIVEEATGLYRRTGTLLHVPSFLRVEAELRGKCGQFDSGLARIAEALAMVAESGERWEEAEIRRTEGELLARAGRLAAAEGAFAEAGRVARTQGAHLFSLRAELSRAELLAKRDQRNEAVVALKTVTKRWGAVCDIPDLSHARRLLAELV
jgi:tetratricopeptide (TPR) repeat protein